MAAEGLRRGAVTSLQLRRENVAFVLAAALLMLGGRPARAATFDFVHVEANAGGSSGGHVAVCLFDAPGHQRGARKVAVGNVPKVQRTYEVSGQHCYHFQQAADATLLLVRENRERFEHGYRAVGNRALVIRRVQVSDDALARIAETFASYHRTQSRQIEARDAYAADRALLAYLRTDQAAQPEVSPSVPGAGYFFSPTDGEREAEHPRMVALGRVIAEVYGADFLHRRAQALLADIHALVPDAGAVVLPAAIAPPSSLPTFFADRYRELLTGYVALSVLEEGRGVRADAFIAPTDDAFALTESEKAVLRAYAAELEGELVRLLASRRPDWGYPLLIGIARLATLDASVASGSLVLLDTFAADARTLPPTAWAGFEDAFDQLLSERGADLRIARAAFFEGDSHSEARWSRIEMAGNLLVEMSRARREATSLRVHDDQLTPARTAWRSNWPTPRLDPATLAASLARAQAREATYRAAFNDLYRYDLVARNCATELLDELAENAAVDDRARAAHGVLAFIPFVAAREIGANYQVVATSTAPSYRQLAVAQAAAHANGLTIHLREANVLTSRVYHWHRADPVFLLFSDDLPALRPLVGIVNLATSLALSGAGLAWLPFDSGTLLGDALNGALYSLPELAFVSIRKGTFPLAPRAWLDAQASN
jgi:hypothetical protein